MNIEKEQPGAPTSEIKNPYVYILDDIHQHVDRVLRDKGMMNKDVSEAIMSCPNPLIMTEFLSRIDNRLMERDRQIAAQKQLTKDEVKRVSDIYQSVIDELKKKYESPS